MIPKKVAHLLLHKTIDLVVVIKNYYYKISFSKGLSKGIVKLLGIIVLPGKRRYFPDVISTDPPFRPPALSPLLQPNSRIAASFLCGTPARMADAVWGDSRGQWSHTRTMIAEHVLLS